MATYKTLAIVDDVHECDCCGKSNLKCTVAMERDDGEIFHFGSVCATKHSGRDLPSLKNEAKAAHAEKVEAARSEYRNSVEEKAYQAKMNEAHQHRIQTGKEFRDYTRAESDTADAKRREIAAKYGLRFFEF